MTVSKRHLPCPHGFSAVYFADELQRIDRTFEHEGKTYAMARHSAILYEQVACRLRKLGNEGKYVPFPEGADTDAHPAGLQFIFETRTFMVLISQPHDVETQTFICVQEDIPDDAADELIEPAAEYFADVFLTEYERLYSVILEVA